MDETEMLSADDATTFKDLESLKNKISKDNKLSYDDLLGLLCILEAEVQAKDVVIKAMMHGRSGMAIPLSHLLTDSDYSDMQCGSRASEIDDDIWLGEPTAHLNHVVAYHQLIREQMSTVTTSLQEQQTQVVQQLEEERYKHAVDTAQGDDVTYMLEKERERLSNQLEFEIGKQKKLEKEKDKLVQSIEIERNQQKAVFDLLMKDCEKYIQSIKILSDREQVLLEILENERNEKKNFALRLTENQEKLRGRDDMIKELREKSCADAKTIVNLKLQIKEYEDVESNEELVFNTKFDEKISREANKIKLTSKPVTTPKMNRNYGVVSKFKPKSEIVDPLVQERKPVSVSISSRSRMHVNGETSPSLRNKKTPPPAPPRVSSISRKSLPVQEMQNSKGSQLKPSIVMSSKIAKLREKNTSVTHKGVRKDVIVLPLAVVAGYGWDYSEENISETNRMVDIISEIGVFEQDTWHTISDKIKDALCDEGELWNQEIDCVLHSISRFRLGSLEWLPDQLPSIPEAPYGFARRVSALNKTSRPLITVKLKDANIGSPDALSFSLLTPLTKLNEYIRLVQQYQGMLFIAKENMEGRHHCTCLAQWLKSMEELKGGSCSIVKLDKDDLEDNLTATEYLIEAGVLRSSNERESTNKSIILLLNTDFIASEYGCRDGLDWLDKRGIEQKFHVVSGPSNVRESFYIPQNHIVIAYATQKCFENMDQKIYRQFKVDHLNYVTSLLIRRWLLQKAKIYHLYDDDMWSTYEWVAWTTDLYVRIKKCLEDLEIQSNIQFPLLFLSAPIRDSKKMVCWAHNLWFDHICPLIKGNALDHTTAANKEHQQLMISVALQTFFDRSFPPCCPCKLEFQTSSRTDPSLSNS